jgi:hypothetical protein
MMLLLPAEIFFLGEEMPRTLNTYKATDEVKFAAVIFY